MTYEITVTIEADQKDEKVAAVLAAITRAVTEQGFLAGATLRAGALPMPALPNNRDSHGRTVIFPSPNTSPYRSANGITTVLPGGWWVHGDDGSRCQDGIAAPVTAPTDDCTHFCAFGRAVKPWTGPTNGITAPVSHIDAQPP